MKCCLLGCYFALSNDTLWLSCHSDIIRLLRHNNTLWLPWSQWYTQILYHSDTLVTMVMVIHSEQYTLWLGNSEMFRHHNTTHHNYHIHYIVYSVQTNKLLCIRFFVDHTKYGSRNLHSITQQEGWKYIFPSQEEIFSKSAIQIFLIEKYIWMALITHNLPNMEKFPTKCYYTMMTVERWYHHHIMGYNNPIHHLSPNAHMLYALPHNLYNTMLTHMKPYNVTTHTSVSVHLLIQSNMNPSQSNSTHHICNL